MTAISNLIEPFGFDSYLENRMNEFFGSTPSKMLIATPKLSSTTMKLDVSETETEYLVHAELPGVRKEDLNVSIDDHVLTIEAEHKEQHEEKTRSYHWRERSFGKVSRVVRLPMDVDVGEPTARYENGVLEVHIEKKQKIDTRKKILIK